MQWCKRKSWGNLHIWPAQPCNALKKSWVVLRLLFLSIRHIRPFQSSKVKIVINIQRILTNASWNDKITKTLSLCIVSGELTMMVCIFDKFFQNTSRILPKFALFLSGVATCFDLGLGLGKGSLLFGFAFLIKFVVLLSLQYDMRLTSFNATQLQLVEHIWHKSSLQEKIWAMPC